MVGRSTEDVVAELKGKGVNVFAKAIDVSKEDELKGFIREAAEAFGGLDILVSNVTGGSLKGPEQWQSSLELDLLRQQYPVDLLIQYNIMPVVILMVQVE